MAVDVSVENAVALVTVDRQEAMNALDVDTLGRLRDVLADVAADREVRCVILTGAGERAFIGGADIEDMTQVDAEQAAAFAALGHEAGRPARDDAEADDRRDQRLRAWRRVRDRARLRHPLRGVGREARPTRGQLRPRPGLGRHPAPRAHDHARLREGAGAHRPACRRRGGVPARPRRRRPRPGARSAPTRTASLVHGEGAGGAGPPRRPSSTGRSVATTPRTCRRRPDALAGDADRPPRHARGWPRSSRSAARASRGSNELRPPSSDEAAGDPWLLRRLPTSGSRRGRPRSTSSHEFPWDVVELFREHGLFALFFAERYGGTGTGTLIGLVAIEEVPKVCATSGLILAVQELGSLSIKLAGVRHPAEGPAASRSSPRASGSRPTR